MYEYISHSEEDTIKFADDFAKDLSKNSVIILTGDLGSGKTKFTEGILRHFGLENQISSPTFTIVNEYNTTDFTIFHFDLYRLSDVDEFFAIGGEEYIHNGACIIEWGEMLEPFLPSGYIKITFSRDEDVNCRKISVEQF